MTKTKLLTLCIFIVQLTVNGQVFTLKQCLQYANDNNKNIKIAYYEKEIAREQVKEQVGTGLPQISATGTITDNVKLATSLMPGALFGQPGTYIPIQTGVQYNTAAAVKLSQKVFDAGFWVGLKAVTISGQLKEQDIQKTVEQTTYDVSNAYYQSLIIQKELDSYNATLVASEKSLASTELKYSNGKVKKVDVDKIRVSYNNTKSQVQQTELSYKQSLNTLKFKIGMPVDSAIILADTMLVDFSTDDYISPSNGFVENRVDYQLQKTNLQIQEAQKQKNIADFFPTLTFDANYSFQAMDNNLKLFNSGQNWYQSSYIDLSLNVPIFSGFQRTSKVEQARLNVIEAEENLKLTEQSIKVEVSNYEIQYKNAIDNIKNEKENLALAESVYNNTQLEFQQGAASSLELIQAESSYREAQNSYFNKLLTLYVARLDVEKSKGSLMNFINNLK